MIWRTFLCDRRRILNSGSRRRGTAVIRSCLPLFLLALLGSVSTVLAYSHPSAGPAGRGTLPPSSYSNTLVNTPHPIDDASNLAVTGNLSGGRSFRGNIPYGSTTSFGGRLGSTSLDPFLRYSAQPEGSSLGSAASGSFYSPTGTVARIPPGQSNVFAPGSPRIAAGVMQTAPEPPADLRFLSETPTFPAPTARPNAGYGPDVRTAQGSGYVAPARTSDEMRRIIAGEPGGASMDQRSSTSSRQLMTAEQYQQQLNQFQHDLDRVSTSASAFEQDLMTGRPPTVPALTPRPLEGTAPTYSAETVRRIIQPQRPPETASPPTGDDRPTTGAEVAPPAGSVSSTWPPSAPNMAGWTQGSASLDQGLSSTPRVVYGDPGVPRVGQGGIDSAPSDLAVGSPSGSPSRMLPSAAGDPRFRPYGQSTGLELSSSELAAQKRRIDTVFAPQTDGPFADSVRSGPPGWSPSRSDPLTAQPRTPPAQTPVPSGIVPPAAPEARTNVSSRASTSPGGPPYQNPLAPRPSEPAPRAVEQATGNAVLPTPVPQPQEPVLPGSGAVGPAGVPARPPTPAPPVSTPPVPAKPATLDVVSQEKFDHYLTAAQAHLQQGQYARAAEFFALAAVYSPRDARPQLGRSHSLLAAGEYLGSAVCLAKAIELDPRTTLAKSPRAKADLLEAVGGPDRFIERIIDLERRAQGSEAPGLQLLLAYIYQQMDRPTEATAAIRLAKKGLPSAAAVDLLQAAIGTGAAP